MRQILQSLKDGTSAIAEVPAPRCGPGQVLVGATVSLVSSGTERMLVEFGKGNLFSKALSQPEKVKQVMEKARSDGLSATFEAVSSKLDQPVALGYCHVGRVIESRSKEFSIGDRVVSNGPHAEVVAVPQNLCARIPDGVSDEEASFTVLAAIGLQGIRLAQPTLGECVAVTGLGLIGLLTVQMLRAHGCRVIGIDPNPRRRELARTFGAATVDPVAENVEDAARSFSRGQGIDAVIITAATKSNEPVSQAARICRKRGRIVLVGVVGLELDRSEFYEKELSFQVSCSYGPGRYDPAYEEQGRDYPIGFVRWTEQRNFQAVLDLMEAGAISASSLISHRFNLADGADAMNVLTSGEESMGILVAYPQHEHGAPSLQRVVSLSRESATMADASAGKVGFLGSGNYASRVLMPAFQKTGVELRTVVSGGGVSAIHFGKKFGFADAASDPQVVYDDPDIDTVVIATRHSSHHAQTLASLKSGKHVFCEKPLCLTLSELEEIQREARARPDQRLLVGFNRRLAPHIVKMKSVLQPIDAPKNVVITVNPGAIPSDHWTQDAEVGGGRIIGEACHFIDLARHLIGHPIAGFRATTLGRIRGTERSEDKLSLILEFEDGSVATILYLANGHRGFPKERVEVFAAGKILQLDNFLSLRGWGVPCLSKKRLWKQDKGADAMVAAFVESIRGRAVEPIPLAEIFEVSRVSIEVAEAVRA